MYSPCPKLHIAVIFVKTLKLLFARQFNPGTSRATGKRATSRPLRL